MIPETPRIAGSDAVVGWFGYWPAFHDAEVIVLQLGDEPVLRLRAFEMSHELDEAGYFKTLKECTVSFWFSGDVDFSLNSESGSGGIVFALSFVEAHGRLQMKIESSVGIQGSITASDWRVELHAR